MLWGIMASEEMASNLSEKIVGEIVDKVTSDFSGVVGALPPSVVAKIEDLILILKAVGIAFIVYVVYLLVNFVINWRRAMIIKRIEEKVDLIGERIGVKGEKKQDKKK